MEKLRDNIIKMKPNLKSNSVAMYIRSLKILYKKLGNDSELKNIDFLEDINLVLGKDIKILILSTIPNTDSNLNSLKCYIKRIDCKYLKSKDYKKRNLDTYFQKISSIIDKNNQGRFLLYNSYDVICPNEICYSYNSNEDFLTHVNDSHLTIEGSQSIKHDFLKFYKENLRYENIE